MNHTYIYNQLTDFWLLGTFYTSVTYRYTHETYSTKISYCLLLIEGAWRGRIPKQNCFFLRVQLYFVPVHFV